MAKAVVPVTALACVLMGGVAQAAPLQLVDQRGVKVSFATSPQRIVSLLPSLTESICALGQCQRLVGVDRYSNHPASVQKLPKLGGGIDPQVEAVVALKPDVVLVATSSRAVTQLESLGLKVLALEPKTHADVQRVLSTLDQMLALPPGAGASKVWREIEAGMQAAAASVPPNARGLKVYFEANRGPYGASEASFIGEALRALGMRNIVPGELGPFPRLNPEFVLRANPDIIMVGERSLSRAAPYPGWEALTAVRDQRVCVFNPADADVLVRAGPRMAEAATLMARCVADKAKIAKS